MSGRPQRRAAAAAAAASNALQRPPLAAAPADSEKGQGPAGRAQGHVLASTNTNLASTSLPASKSRQASLREFSKPASSSRSRAALAGDLTKNKPANNDAAASAATASKRTNQKAADKPRQTRKQLLADDVDMEEEEHEGKEEEKAPAPAAHASKKTTTAKAASALDELVHLANKQLANLDDASLMTKTLKQCAEHLANTASFTFADRRANAAFAKLIVTSSLMRHDDRDVRLLVSVCTVHILRLYSPDAPYNDEQVEEVFRLLVSAAMPRLDAGVNGGAAAAQRVQAILQVLAETKCAVLLLDLESDDVLVELARSLLSEASASRETMNVAGPNVLDIFASIFDETDPDEISQSLLDALLVPLTRRGDGARHRQLAGAVLARCEARLAPRIQRFLASALAPTSSRGSGAGGVAAHEVVRSDVRDDVHEVVASLYTCVPGIVAPVLPCLVHELEADDATSRARAMDCVGSLVSGGGAENLLGDAPELVPQFLRRCIDRDASLRAHAIEWLRKWLLPQGDAAAITTGKRKAAATTTAATPLVDAGDDDAPAVVKLDSSARRTAITYVSGRLIDPDEKVRTAAVGLLCALDRADPSAVEPIALRSIGSRLRDKRGGVRREAAKELGACFGTFAARTLRRGTGGVSSPTTSEVQAQLADGTKEGWWMLPALVAASVDSASAATTTRASAEIVSADDVFPSEWCTPTRSSPRAYAASWMLAAGEAFRAEGGAASPAAMALRRSVATLLATKKRVHDGVAWFLRKRRADAGAAESVVGQPARTLATYFPEPEKAREHLLRMARCKDRRAFAALDVLLDVVGSSQAQRKAAASDACARFATAPPSATETAGGNKAYGEHVAGLVARLGTACIGGDVLAALCGLVRDLAVASTSGGGGKRARGGTVDMSPAVCAAISGAFCVLELASLHFPSILGASSSSFLALLEFGKASSPEILEHCLALLMAPGGRTLLSGLEAPELDRALKCCISGVPTEVVPSEKARAARRAAAGAIMALRHAAESAQVAKDAEAASVAEAAMEDFARDWRTRFEARPSDAHATTVVGLLAQAFPDCTGGEVSSQPQQSRGKGKRAAASADSPMSSGVASSLWALAPSRCVVKRRGTSSPAAAELHSCAAAAETCALALGAWSPAAHGKEAITPARDETTARVAALCGAIARLFEPAAAAAAAKDADGELALESLARAVPVLAKRHAAAFPFSLYEALAAVCVHESADVRSRVGSVVNSLITFNVTANAYAPSSEARPAPRAARFLALAALRLAHLGTFTAGEADHLRSDVRSATAAVRRDRAMHERTARQAQENAQGTTSHTAVAMRTDMDPAYCFAYLLPAFARSANLEANGTALEESSTTRLLRSCYALFEACLASSSSDGSAIASARQSLAVLRKTLACIRLAGDANDASATSALWLSADVAFVALERWLEESGHGARLAFGAPTSAALPEHAVRLPTWCYRNAQAGDSSSVKVPMGPLGASVPDADAVPSEREVAPHVDGMAAQEGKPRRTRKAAGGGGTAAPRAKKARRAPGGRADAAADNDDEEDDEDMEDAEVTRPSPQPIRHQRATRAAVAAGVAIVEEEEEEDGFEEAPAARGQKSAKETPAFDIDEEEDDDEEESSGLFGNFKKMIKRNPARVAAEKEAKAKATTRQTRRR